MWHFALIAFALTALTAAQDGVINVPGDYPTIQEALDAASQGDTVLVSPGVYVENLVWPATQGISLLSQSGPGLTIIDGHEDGRVIEITSGVTTSTVISGFTIMNGWVYPGAGAGIYLQWSSPTITGNVITGNDCTEHTSGWGGGIYCYGSSAVIEDNTILDNCARMGGGIACRECSPLINGNTISGNSVQGDPPDANGLGQAALCTDRIGEESGSMSDLDYCLGGGIACFDNSSPLISGNEISDNSCSGFGGAGGGVYCYNNSSPVVTGNTITENAGGMGVVGGGIYVELSCPTITGNQIYGNGPVNQGGGIFLNASASLISDNWIAFNKVALMAIGGTGAGIRCVNGSTPSIIGNDILSDYCLNSYGLGGGVHCNQSAPLIENCNICENGDGGVISLDGSDPVINCCNISSNTEWGVYNSDETLTIDAEYNWWGDPSGPGGVGPGTGDPVSDYVDYDPWLTEQGIEGPTPQSPSQLSIYPNPVGSSSVVSFVLGISGSVSVRVYDLSGRAVETLFEGQLETGTHSFELDAERLPPGVYLLRLDEVGASSSAKCILLH